MILHLPVNDATTARPVVDRSDLSASKALTVNQAIKLQMRLFDALGREDKVAWDELAAPDFRAFERGKEFAKREFFQILVDAHKSGKQLRWSVAEARVQSDLNLVILSYVNVGSIALNGGDPTPTRWLETAAYRRAPGGWQLVLLTSERSADAQPVQSACPPPR